MLSPGERKLEIAEIFNRRDGQDAEMPVARFPYLPLNRIEDWDLRYENVLEELLYMQNLIAED
jgi:hypothetical protein